MSARRQFTLVPAILERPASVAALIVSTSHLDAPGSQSPRIARAARATAPSRKLGLRRFIRYVGSIQPSSTKRAVTGMDVRSRRGAAAAVDRRNRRATAAAFVFRSTEAYFNSCRMESGFSNPDHALKASSAVNGIRSAGELDASQASAVVVCLAPARMGRSILQVNRCKRRHLFVRYVHRRPNCNWRDGPPTSPRRAEQELDG